MMFKPSSTNQDPSKAYIVFMDRGGKHRIVPLTDGEYYIGRARQQGILNRELARSHPGKHPVWLPSRPGPSPTIPVGRMTIRGASCQLIAGWPGRAARERITISFPDLAGKGEIHKLANGIKLEGFETISFEGEPKAQAWYIPPLAGFKMGISDRILYKLERAGLWASAATGWEIQNNYRQAKFCWERALEICEEKVCSHLEKANVMLGLAHVLRVLNISDNTIRALQAKAARLSDALPEISYHSSGNAGFQGQQLHIKLFVENITPGRSLEKVLLRYHCHDLGVYRRFEIESIPSRGEETRDLRIMGIQNEGVYPVDVLVEAALADGKCVEYHFRDTIKIVKRPPRVRVGRDAGAISIEVEKGTEIPDIDVGSDVGLVRIRVRKE